MRNSLIIIICLSIGCLMWACGTEKKDGSSQTQQEIKTVRECFRHIAAKDTVTIMLDIAGNNVTGLLMYNFYEKDKSQGTLVGEMRGDTLIADYTFSAEGVVSVREVAFLKQPNQLMQGFGETSNAEGKEVFKNKATLRFDNALVLTTTECEKK